jgi:hypothetical protein
MRSFINYLRQCFCKHELKIEEETVIIIGSIYGNYDTLRVSQTCNKCGYHKSYNKY